MFPSPDANERSVHFIHVPDGRYSRGTTQINRVEAEWLVDLVIDQVRQEPHKSVGVITFSERQMVTIQSEIDPRKRDYQTLEPLLREAGSDAFFVKNLENVQGDERDIIFFSVGYGPDGEGKMTMNLLCRNEHMRLTTCQKWSAFAEHDDEQVWNTAWDPGGSGTGWPG